MKLELHCHSHYSRGRKIPIEGLDSPADLARAAKKLGLQGIALTDHDSDRGWAEAKEACRRHGLVFIPSIEISSLSGHVIGLGLNEKIRSGLPLEETLEKIHEQGAVSVAAHPFDISRDGIGKLAGKACVIEAFNSMNLDRFSNLAAGRFAEKACMPSIGGSDSHTKEMLGCSINEIDAQDLDSCLRQIKAGKVSFQASYIPLEKLFPWVKQRFSLSYGDVLQYIDSNYPEPRKWLSKRLLHSFTSSRREGPWYLLGEAGLAGAKGYGLARMVITF